MFNLFQYTEEKCAKDVIKIIEKLAPDSNPVYEPEKEQVTSGSHIVYLGNIYSKSKHLSRKERIEYLTSFISSAFEEQDISYEDSAHLLIPRLKSHFEIALRELSADFNNTPHHKSVNYEVSPSFVFEIGIDLDASILVVFEDQLKEMSLSKDEAWSIAQKNLFEKCGNSFQELFEGCYRSRFEDDHDAARILAIDEIKQLKLKGVPVALPLTPNTLIICGSEDIEAFDKILSALNDIVEGHRTLSFHPMILVDDQWQDFKPDHTDEYAPVLNLIRYEDCNNYNEQKKYLDVIHEQSGKDVFVATYQLLPIENSPHYLSIAAWTQNVDTLLPKTDSLMLLECKSAKPKEIGTVSFEKALQVLGDLMKPVGLIPERYRVTDFPNEKQLKELGVSQ